MSEQLSAHLLTFDPLAVVVVEGSPKFGGHLRHLQVLEEVRTIL